MEFAFVKEHYNNLWHVTKDEAGYYSYCGRTIGGMPAVIRIKDSWTPPVEQICPGCAILFVRQYSIEQRKINFKLNLFAWIKKNFKRG